MGKRLINHKKPICGAYLSRMLGVKEHLLIADGLVFAEMLFV